MEVHNLYTGVMYRYIYNIWNGGHVESTKWGLLTLTTMSVCYRVCCIVVSEL